MMPYNSIISRLWRGALACLLVAACLEAGPCFADDFTARHLGDYGNVTVMEVSGNYDAKNPDGSVNALPRQAIAKEFFRLHKDEYDFVVVFTNFDFKMPSAEVDGFYEGTKNDIKGIGRETFDNTALYGSAGHLQGTIDMGTLAGKVSNPLDPNFENTLRVLVHEMQHRWGSYVRFMDASGNVSTALLGQDGAHWSYLLDSKGSVMYGNPWQDNGDGTFTALAGRKYYSPLDLYLMGMIDKSKVPPILLIDNPAIDPKKLPEPGTTITGAARYVKIDDIIAAEGERIPNATDSQKQFKTAFIYAVSPNSFKCDDLYGIENIRNGYLTRYSILTGGKGLVQVASTPKDNLAVNPGIRSGSSTPRSLPPSIDNAVTWLMNRQQSDGSWAEFPLTTERDTAESVTTLQHFPIAVQSFQTGFAWLGNNSSSNTDFLARRIEASIQAGSDSSALVQELLARRNRDGGWGSNRNFISSSTDTALALKALAVAGYNDGTVTGPAIAFLQGTQNGDGGWSGDDVFSTIQPTTAVLTAFNFYRKNTSLDSNLTKAAAFLASKQNPDGGFGNSPSTVYDSALSVIALQASGADKTLSGRGISYLLGQQSDNGSWFDSPFQTALAVKAVWAATIDPDLSIKPEDISIIPATITTIPTNAVLSATVWNLGRNDVSQARVAVYDGIVTPEKKVAEQIVAFPGQSPVTLTFSIPVTDSKGHVFYVVADPDNQLVESNKNNNNSAKSLLSEITYDFQVLASDIATAPNPADIGKDVKISIKVSNSGTSDAFNVPVRVFINQQGAPLEIAMFSVDLPAGGAAVKEMTWKASQAGVNQSLTVQIDPNNTFSETNKDNNSASVPLTVNASTLPNLSVSYKDMVITPTPAREGGNASISVLVKNDGFSTAQNVKVNAYKGTASNGGTLLGSQVIPVIQTGQSQLTTVVWPGIAVNGGQLITVQVDPDNSIQEISKEDNSTFINLDVLSLPDLAVSTNSVVINPAMPKSGDTVTITVNVQNGGDQEVSNVNVQVKEGGTIIGSTVIPLVSGNSQASGAIAYVNAGQTGSHQITVTVDPENLIVERSKDNNNAIRSFSIQDANLSLTEPYISPNGDSVKDATDFSFRLAASIKVSVQVVNTKGIAIRTFSGGELDNTPGTTITWDGKNDAGSVVDDGSYQIKVINANNSMLASLPVEVDTNRSQLADAIGTPYLLQTNMTCQLPFTTSYWNWLPHDSGVSFSNDYAIQGYQSGSYQMSPTGEDVRRITPDNWSDSNYDYLVDPDSSVSPDSARIAFVVWKKEKISGNEKESIWVQDMDGQGRREVASGLDLNIGNLKWSPDSKKFVFAYGQINYLGYYAYELRLVDTETTNMATIAEGYPYWYTDGMAWSPDSSSVVYSVNIHCNADKSHCDSNNETLNVSDVNGAKRVIYTSTNNIYSFSNLRWFADGMFMAEETPRYGTVRLMLFNTIDPVTPIVLQTKSDYPTYYPVFDINPDLRSIALVSNQQSGTNISRRLKVVGLDGAVVTDQDMGLVLQGYNGPTDNPVWSQTGDKLAYIERELQSADNKVYENLIVFDRTSSESTKHTIAVSNPPTFDNYSGNTVSFKVNHLVAWLADKVTMLVDTVDGFFAVNTESGAISSILPIEQGVNDPGVSVSPGQQYITYYKNISSPGTCAKQSGQDIWSISSLLNLTADLNITKNTSVIKLKGIATDKNFAGYRMEYADLKSPSSWNLIMPPSDVPVVNDTFIDWIPPNEGAFNVKLTVWDKAGNEAVDSKRVAWGISTLVTGLYRDNEFIAPKNPDNPKNTVTLHYTALGAVHLEFTIVNEKGAAVRAFTRDQTGYAVDSIIWDGRDENGQLVPDGKYTFKLFDYEFIVEVDNTLPDASIGLSPINYNSKDNYFYANLTAAASDARLKKWTIQTGEGENPSEWTDIDSNTKAISDYILTYDNGKISYLKNRRFRIVVEDFAGNRSTRTSEIVNSRVELASIGGTFVPPNPQTSFTFQKDRQYILSGFETLPAKTTKVTLQYSEGKNTWIDVQEGSDGGFISFVWQQSITTIKPYALRFKVVSEGGAENFSGIITANETFSASAACGPSLFGQNDLFEQLQKLDVAVTSDTGKSVSQSYVGSNVPSGIFGLPMPTDDNPNNPSKSFTVLMSGAGISGKNYTYSGGLTIPKCTDPTDHSGSVVNPVDMLGSIAGGSTTPFDIIYPEALACGKASGEIQLPTERLSIAGATRVDYLVKVGNSTQVIGEVNIEVEGPRRVSIDSSLLPSGSYPLSVIVTNKDNTQKQTDLGKVIVFDTEAPLAQLILPASPCPVRTATPKGTRLGVEISGSAKDNIRVAHYTLYYGIGENPSSWSPAMSTGSDGVSKSISGDGAVSGQLGTWDFTDIPGTVFTLKLEVVDAAGNKGCATGVVRVDREVKINGYTLAPLAFSPNNDGNLDVATAGFSLDEPATVDLSVNTIIKDANSSDTLGTVLRRIQPGLKLNAGAATFNWDGKGDSGAILPDNRYGVSLTVTDACGNTASQWKTVELDNTLPSTSIDYPLPGNPLPPGVMIEIKGTATDSHFKSYVLEAGAGDTPTTWSTVATSDKPIANAVIAPWNTFGLKDHWTVRLTAEDTAGNKKIVTSTIDLGVRKELVKSLDATPKLFSPNNDQKLDTSLISYEVADACNLNFDILDGSGQVVRTFTPVTTAVAGKGNLVWDGKSGPGSTAPDGLYTVRLVASLTANPQVTQTETISINVDTTTPAITLTDLTDKSFLNRTDLSIAGTVDDANLVNYTITIAGPSGTATLDTGTQNRTNYTFGRITDLVEDTYTLTVDAKDQGENSSKLVRTFTVDRTAPKATLDTPRSGDYYGNTKNVIDISGSIVEKNLDRYSLRYGVGETPTDWKEVVGGNTAPTSTKLAALKVGKTDGIADGIYTLSLFAKDKAGLEGEIRTKIVIDNTSPQVVITSPSDGAYVTKPLDITGTAADAYFDSATLELAAGSCVSAINWVAIKTSNATVQDGILNSWKILPADGEYCLRLSAADKSGNKSDTKTGFKIDTHPPAAPQLTGKIDNKVDAVLSWTKNSETDLSGYNIYRNNLKINTALLTDISYRDPSLKEGSYTYSVKSVDFAGNESDPSNVIALKIDLTGPTVRISAPSNGSTVSSLIDVKGTAYSQDDFKEYRVYVGQGGNPSSWTLIRRSPLPISFGSLAQWDTITSQDGAQFTVKLEGEDLSGNISTTQATVTIDNTPPKAPILLATAASSADVTLTWKTNTEPDLAGYLLYRNDQLANVKGIVAGNLKPYLVTGTAYVDKALPDGTYRYYLVAMDQAGNSSDQSNTLEVTIDTHPPHMTITDPVSGLKFDAKLPIKAETPDIDIASVQFQYKRSQDTVWTNLASPLVRSPFIMYLDPKSLGLAYGGYQLQVLSVDKGGKSDPAPPAVTVTYTDITPPAVPASLAAKVNGADVTLTWSSNTESDLSGYNIYRWNNGAKTKCNSTVVKIPGYLDPGVPNGSYNYEITTVDIAGNESNPSGQAAALVYTPLVSQPYTPVKISSLVLEGSSVMPGSTVEITILQTGGVTVKTSVAADSAGFFKLEGIILSLGENRFTAVATDLVGNVSKSSDTIVVSYGVAPAAPTGLAASVSNSDVSLTWNRNSEPDIIGYNLFRDDEKVNTAVAVTGGQASASFQDYYAMPENAIDGNSGTYWSTPYGYGTFTPAWWQMSLPTPELINRVDINWQLGDWDYANSRYNILAGKDYEIQAWTGYNWLTLKKVSGNNQQYNTIDISPSYRTNQIRIAISSTTDQNDSKYVKIKEIKFHKDNLLSSTNYTDPGLLDHRYSYTLTAIDQYGFEAAPRHQLPQLLATLNLPARRLLSRSRCKGAMSSSLGCRRHR